MVSLITFTCEGREHLLPQTLDSFAQSCSFKFDQRWLAIDGPYRLSPEIERQFDRILYSPCRRGYIRSILNTLSNVEDEFFFWLEDDWHFPRPVDLEFMLDYLRSHPDCAQVRLSKVAPLEGIESTPLAAGVHPSAQFSANPCLCRSRIVADAFRALQESSRDPALGFEEFVTDWLKSHDSTYAVLDPGDLPAVEHSGYLESTPRQWHMTASADVPPQDYLSGHRGSPPPHLARRCWMAAKFLVASARVLVGMLFSREFYDIAFRFCAVVTTTRRTNTRQSEKS